MTAIQETSTTAPTGRGRAIRRNAALGGIVGAAAILTSGCTLSDISTVLSILRLLGIGG